MSKHNGLRVPAKLRRRIKALPQELQDHILDFILIIDPRVVYIERRSHLGNLHNRGFEISPSSLALDQKTRNTAARHYFSTSTFRVVDHYHNFGWGHRLVSWLSTLTPEHRAMITDIRVDNKGVNAGPPTRNFSELWKAQAENVGCQEASKFARLTRYWLKNRYGWEFAPSVLKCIYFVVLDSRCDGTGACKDACYGACRFAECWATEEGAFDAGLGKIPSNVHLDEQ